MGKIEVIAYKYVIIKFNFYLCKIFMERKKVLHQWCYLRVKPKTMKLVFVASPLSTALKSQKHHVIER
jgi:hypothetical protein